MHGRQLHQNGFASLVNKGLLLSQKSKFFPSGVCLFLNLVWCTEKAKKVSNVVPLKKKKKAEILSRTSNLLKFANMPETKVQILALCLTFPIQLHINHVFSFYLVS